MKSAYIIVLLCMAFASAMGADESSLEKKVEFLQKNLASATRQMMLQQFFVEETRRTDGNSGLKQIRYKSSSTDNYKTPSHVGRSVAAIHDHSNYIRLVGMGEFIAAINGIEFRTRHNDYKLRMPHRTSKEYGKTEDIPFPEVPPSVRNQNTTDDQIKELYNYFEAWKNSDHSKYDYRKYFQPLMCYLEGAWTKANGDKIDEPFESDRHFIDANGWFDLQERVRYTSYTGTKSRLENLAYLPTTIMEFINDTIPVFAQWNYRIMCHPIKQEVPLSHVVLVDDLKTRMKSKQTLEKYASSRAARFSLKRDIPNKQIKRGYKGSLLDVIMAEIPGKDNYPGKIFDKTIDGNKVLDLDGREIDVSRYNRAFKTEDKDAMGVNNQQRGFSDNNLFAAKTEQPKIAGLERPDITNCTIIKKKKVCKMVRHRWSYAIPLELIYLTPLSSWNPYKLTMRTGRDAKRVTAGGRTGDCRNPSKYWDGVSRGKYYITPSAFFSGGEKERDPADTTRGESCVIDPNDKPQKVVASGIRIFLPEIKGIGTLRTRFPIFPVYGEGSPVWKELNALIDYIMNPNAYPYIKPNGNGGGTDVDKDTVLKTGPSRSTKTTTHYHSVTLTSIQVAELKADKNMTLQVTTSTANGHEHDLDLYWDSKRKKYFYKQCDSRKICWDRHGRRLIVTEGN